MSRPTAPPSLNWGTNISLFSVKEKQPIDLVWAAKIIKRYAAKTFLDKECAYENLHELYWTILFQRPDLRTDIIEVCKTQCPQYAEYWQRISTANASIADVPRDIPMVTGDPLDASIVTGDPSSLFPMRYTMRKLIFVNTEKLMGQMWAHMEWKAERPEGVRLALDAEWSRYEMYSAASILQIALDDVTYIVDVDSLPSDLLQPYIDMIFSHPKILKLGFHFHADLAQLRMAKSLRGCESLDSPKNLSCILQLIVDLSKETGWRSNSAEIHREFAALRVSRGQTPSLSSLCQSLLGLPLDKRETCSLRYAMDAYCLLLLHSRCKEWAEKLGVAMEEMMKRAAGAPKIR